VSLATITGTSFCWAGLLPMISNTEIAIIFMMDEKNLITVKNLIYYWEEDTKIRLKGGIHFNTGQ
jgi:hypothetical protein